MIEYSNEVMKRKKAADRSAAKRARIDNPCKLHGLTNFILSLTPGLKLILFVFFSAVPKRSSGRIKEAEAAKVTNEILEPNVDNSADEEGSDFVVKMYFTPSVWASMSLIVKRHAQNALEDYQNAKSNGIMSPFNVYEYAQLHLFVLLIN